MARKEPSMLVLSRQRDETIMIGDDVEITVVDIRGDKVRLGITAPRHIQVHRKEVYDAIKRENQQAANLTPQEVAGGHQGGFVMSRINSNISSLIAQRHLGVSQQSLTKSLERLSSGLRINRGADDPAGLIVSERLRSEIAVVEQAIDNSARAINVIATAEGALDEVQALLTDIQAKLVEAANSGAFSKDEIAANQ